MTNPLDPTGAEDSTPGSGAEITYVQGNTFIKIKDAAASHRELLESIITLIIGARAEMVTPTGVDENGKPTGKTDGGYV